MTGPAMAALRRTTREAHARTEADLDGDQWLASRAAYGCCLRRMLRFHEAVEAAVAPFVGRLEGLDHRRRSPLVRADLQAIGERVAPFPDVARTEVVGRVLDGPAGALGCLYVVEGSALGGAVVVRRVTRTLGYDARHGASSFVPYGPATGRRWRAFGEVVESWVQTRPDDLPALLDAAAETFEAHRAIVGAGAHAATVPP